MRLTERVHVVGGSGLSHALDCHVYLLDGGDELALVDAGGGRGARAIVEAITASGFDPTAVRHLLLTHGHGDHAAGAAALRRLLPSLRIHAAPPVRGWLADGDDGAVSIDVARTAGMYPADFTLEACATDADLVAGGVVAVGDLRLAVIETPGHSRGHVSLLLEHDGRRDLLAGDAIFAGGRVALQPLWDCSLAEQTATLRALRGLALDGLFAGHGEHVVGRAHEHVERANALLDALQVPEPLHPPAPWNGGGGDCLPPVSYAAADRH
jgi:glyoxylase-like metal-dependent hydrolase (beta-lactamase superfamily II)